MIMGFKKKFLSKKLEESFSLIDSLLTSIFLFRKEILETSNQILNSINDLNTKKTKEYHIYSLKIIKKEIEKSMLEHKKIDEYLLNINSIIENCIKLLENNDS